jgi:hypothetical protein
VTQAKPTKKPMMASPKNEGKISGTASLRRIENLFKKELT